MKLMTRATDKPRKAKLLELKASTLKWWGFALVALNTFGVAVIQRPLLGLENFTTNDALLLALQPGTKLFGLSTVAIACTMLSTLALPIYAKLLVEGFNHTADVGQYLARLLLCAFLSEIPYDMAMRGRLFDFSTQNPVWGLAVILLLLMLLRRYALPHDGAKKLMIGALLAVAAAVWVILIQSQLGLPLLLLSLLFWIFEDDDLCTMLGGIPMTLLQFPAPFGLLFVYWYGGQKGAEDRSRFYWLYPAQLLALWAVGMVVALL